MLDRCKICKVLRKFSIVFLVLILLKIFDGLTSFINSTNIWWFIGIFILLEIIQFYCLKKGLCKSREEKKSKRKR